jgi:hypothetical protein
MTASGTELDALTAAGVRWHDSGQASLTGPVLRLATELDRAFAILGDLWQAEPEQHPATIPAARMHELGYLRSFPHQVSFAVALDGSPANLDGFRAGPMVTADGVQGASLAPIQEILTPAACYHIYGGHRGERLDGPRYLTTRNTCFRREDHYRPLRRQWSFTMREIVCLGSESNATAFADRARVVVSEFAEHLGLPIGWEPATDPFFRPETDPRYLLQKIQPLKIEGSYGDLAIASVNRHFEHFGELMDIEVGGAPAHSACLAFGTERWLYALLDTHGTDAQEWPDLTQAALDVRSRMLGW